LKQAEKDLKHAEFSLKIGEYEWACFAAHQAVWKALKAFLLSCGADVRSNSITVLLKEVSRRIKVPQEFSDVALILDSYYMPFRYPDIVPEAFPSAADTQKDARNALMGAKRIIDFIRGVIRE